MIVTNVYPKPPLNIRNDNQHPHAPTTTQDVSYPDISLAGLHITRYHRNPVPLLPRGTCNSTPPCATTLLLHKSSHYTAPCCPSIT